MKKTQKTFASLLNDLGNHHDLRIIFDDFLTMSLCLLSYDPATGTSYDEDLYLQIIARYKTGELPIDIPGMIAYLTTEIHHRLGSSEGSDVLGEFYEQNLYRQNADQHFIPWHICRYIAPITIGHATKRTQTILDPYCHSGRLLLHAGNVLEPGHQYCGIDMNPIYVKMAAINLFLHGVFESEVMCGDALNPYDFKGSYKISFRPFGVFRVTEKQESPLWRMYLTSFEKLRADNDMPELTFEDVKTKRTYGSKLQFI